MFTGIVEELGRVDGIEAQPDVVRLTVRGRLTASRDVTDCGRRPAAGSLPDGSRCPSC